MIVFSYIIAYLISACVHTPLKESILRYALLCSKCVIFRVIIENFSANVSRPCTFGGDHINHLPKRPGVIRWIEGQ